MSHYEQLMFIQQGLSKLPYLLEDAEDELPH